MNALYATLTGKISILLSIDFQSIKIKFYGSDEQIIEKTSLFNKINQKGFTRKLMMQSNAFRRLVDSGEASPDHIFELIQKKINGEEYVNSSIYRRIYLESALDHHNIEELINVSVEEIGFSSNSKLQEIFEKIKPNLQDTSILYLPTYRRIEAETDKEESNQKAFAHRRTIFRVKSEWDSDKLMYFGLSDVDDELKHRALNIRQKALQAYSRASGETLKRLMYDASDNTNFEKTDLEKITVVLNRIGKENVDIDNISQDIKKFFDDESINSDGKQELRSFLKQLLNIYGNTADEEKAIEDFVDVINSYWDDDSEKKFVFNKQNAEAEVHNLYTGKKLLLNMLSSGEKQIISILARMILEPTKKYLVLIDEPELSLSLEWQKRFLLDVVKCLSCRQLIAITHSPFIFDNELQPYAGSFAISYIKDKG